MIRGLRLVQRMLRRGWLPIVIAFGACLGYAVTILMASTLLPFLIGYRAPWAPSAEIRAVPGGPPRTNHVAKQPLIRTLADIEGLEPSETPIDRLP